MDAMTRPSTSSRATNGESVLTTVWLLTTTWNWTGSP